MFSGISVQAQTNAVPAEFPPSSFTGSQFVDSEGCAFIRAGVGGAVSWVPRVDRSRNQLCNFQPTFAQAPAAEPASVIAAAPAPQEDVGPPIQTVASTGLVQIPTADTPTARSPRVVRDTPTPAPVPAPVVAAAAPVVTPTAPALQTRSAFCVGRTGPQPGFVSSIDGTTIDCGGVPAPTFRQASAKTAPAAPAQQTRSAFCVGRTGLQPGYLNATTGETIDCGGTAAPAVQQASLAPKARLSKSEFCVGRTGLQPGYVSSRTGETINCGGAAAAPLRMTMTQICADVWSTGRTFVNAQTGLPVRCGPQSQQIASGPFSPTGPAGPVSPTNGSASAANCPSSILIVNGQTVRCGPQTQALTASAKTFTSDTRTARSRTSTKISAFSNLFKEAPVPASNPRGVSNRQVLPVPKGYTRVWKDGRHNPNRGLPAATAAREAAPLQAQPVRSRVTSQASSKRYVQVGVFANTAAAMQVGQDMQARGLPVGLASASGGKAVVLGPFANASELNRGLSAARSAGYGGAFARN